MSQDNGYEISSLSEKNSIFRGDIMFGYTTKWSVDMIEELIDNGHFERKNKGDVVQAINDLEVYFKYNKVKKQRYEYLKLKLKEILNSKV